MMNNKKKIRLNKTENITATNIDGYINLNLEQKSKEIIESDVIKEYDIKSQYEKDRLECNTFRFITEIDPIITNVLQNITGKDSLCIFNEIRFRQNELKTNIKANPLTFIESVNTNRINLNGIYGYYEAYADSFDVDKEFHYLEPKPERFQISKYPTWEMGGNFDVNAENENWFIETVYPTSGTTNHYLIDGVYGNGVIVAKLVDVTINNNKYIQITSPIKHNLSLDPNITVRLFDGRTDQTFTVFGLGDEFGNNLEYDFIIPGSLAKYPFRFGLTRFNRVYGGQQSNYYVRIFNKIDLELDTTELGFSVGCLGDKNVQTIPQNKLNLSLNDLRDNLNRPISSMFLYIQKKEDTSFFTDIDSGFDLNPKLYDYYNNDFDDVRFSDIHKIHTRTDLTSKPSHTKVSTITDTSPDESILGDICEWNPLEYKEYSLTDICHRFNSINREWTVGNPNTTTSSDNIQYVTMVSVTPYHGTTIKRDVVLNYDWINETTMGGTTNNFSLINNIPTNTASPRYDDYYFLEGQSSRNLTNLIEGCTNINVPKIEGYYYKPLYEIKIKEFSEDISETYTGATTDYEFETPPEYATELAGGKFVWREILNPNEDSLKLPMSNKSFYVNSKLQFHLKRQDPFGGYGLSDANDPLTIGVSKTNTDNIIKENNSQKC